MFEEESEIADEVVDSPQRWKAKRRAALVLSILRGQTSAAEAARKHGLTVGQVEEWRELFVIGVENAVRYEKPIRRGSSAMPPPARTRAAAR